MTQSPQATIAIPVYKKVDNLHAILVGLSNQSFKNFEIIITEDDRNPAVAAYLQSDENPIPDLIHITQPDQGYRKSRALNRAVAISKSDFLIILDGDCVPHPRFIESHVQERRAKCVGVGRRAQLGPRISALLIRHPRWIRYLSNRAIYLFLLLPVSLLERIKNFEAGLYSPLLQYINRNKQIALVGCNFSFNKQDLIEINGFDEAYSSYGWEDSDLEWRLTRNNVRMKNLKFLAQVYHLDHGPPSKPAQENLEHFQQTQRDGRVVCLRGLNQY